MIHLTLWYLYLYWQKPKEKSQVSLWCIPVSFRYINNQIWRVANKNRINIINILTKNLQATGLENQGESPKGN